MTIKRDDYIVGSGQTRNIQYSDLISDVSTIPLKSSDSVIVTSFDEFGYDVTVQSSSDSSKHFNAIYQWLVQGNSSPTKTDFSYTIENDIARIGHVENIIMWVNWFSDNTSSPTYVRPALSDTVKNEINTADWKAGGYQSDSTSIINIPDTFPISGSQNDSSLVRGALELQKRGYKPGFLPITRYIDIGTQNEIWRGEIDWDNTTDFTSWASEYETFFKHYIDLFWNNNVDLGIIYLGSEMRNLAVNYDFTTDINRIWINTLIELARYSKEKFPNSIVVYAADWTEYRYNLDRIWVDANVDRIGIEWYFPVITEHSNDEANISMGMWQGEFFDYNYSGLNTDEFFNSTTSGAGKTGLTQTTLSNSAQDKNWRHWLNNPHYFQKRSGAITDASPLVIDKNNINRLFDEYSANIITGTGTMNNVLDNSMHPTFESGPNASIGINTSWIEFDGSTYAETELPSKLKDTSEPITHFKTIIVFDFDNNPSNDFPRLLRFNNFLDIFYDKAQEILKIKVVQANSSLFLDFPSQDLYAGVKTIEIEITPTGLDYNLNIKFYGGNDDYENSTVVTLTNTEIGNIFSSPNIFLGAFDSSNDHLPCNIYYFNYDFQIKNDQNYYGGTYYFEDQIYGVRNEYKARFQLNQDKPLMATELGVASINGSLVQPSKFPISKWGGSYIPNTNTKEYWEAVSQYGLTISDIEGPYGSTFDSDEMHQKIGLAILLNRLRQAGIEGTAIYNIDARYYLSYTAITDGQLWYLDAGDHLYNHALNGKRALGYIGNILDKIKP